MFYGVKLALENAEAINQSGNSVDRQGWIAETQGRRKPDRVENRIIFTRG